jgi:hypothetical protein
LASGVFGRAANDCGQVRLLRHDFTVVDDAEGEHHQRHKRHQQRELDRNGAGLPAVMVPPPRPFEHLEHGNPHDAR